MIDALGGPVLVIISVCFLFALLGLAGSCIHQWREWRKRRMMRGDR